MKNQGMRRTVLAGFLVANLLATGVIGGDPVLAEDEGAKEPQKMTVKTYCTLKGKPGIRWKKVAKSAQYRVYRSTKKAGKYKKIATVKKLAYTDKKTTLKKKYYYQVKAVKKDGTIIGTSKPVAQKALKTVLCGDSTMEAVPVYGALPRSMMLTKIGINTTTFYNTRLNTLIRKKPDRVFIMLGMNELAWRSTGQTVKGMGRIVKRLKKKRPGVQIIVLAVSPSATRRASDVPSQKKIHSCNRQLKKATKKWKVQYYDWTAAFKDRTGHLKRSCNGGDGCHWTPSGARVFVKQMAKYAKRGR